MNADKSRFCLTYSGSFRVFSSTEEKCRTCILFICLFVYLFIYVFIYLFLYLFICYTLYYFITGTKLSSNNCAFSIGRHLRRQFQLTRRPREATFFRICVLPNTSLSKLGLHSLFSAKSVAITITVTVAKFTSLTFCCRDFFLKQAYSDPYAKLQPKTE